MSQLVTRLKNLLRKPIRVAFGRRTLTIRGEGGGTLTFPPAEYPSLLWGIRAFEPGFLAEWRTLLQPGEAILDVGANIGLTVQRFCSLLSDRCSVIAFEPSQRNFDLLVKNIASISNATAFPVKAAVCDLDGEVEFADNIEHGGLSRLASLDAYKAKNEAMWSSSAMVKVPALRIDSFLVREHPEFAPSFLKIDVEGAAGDVLAGAGGTLAKHHPLIHCSFHFALEENAVIAALADHGYQGLRFRGERPELCPPTQSRGYFIHPTDPRFARLGPVQA